MVTSGRNDGLLNRINDGQQGNRASSGMLRRGEVVAVRGAVDDNRDLLYLLVDVEILNASGRRSILENCLSSIPVQARVEDTAAGNIIRNGHNVLVNVFHDDPLRSGYVVGYVRPPQPQIVDIPRPLPPEVISNEVLDAPGTIPQVVVPGLDTTDINTAITDSFDGVTRYSLAPVNDGVPLVEFGDLEALENGRFVVTNTDMIFTVDVTYPSLSIGGIVGRGGSITGSHITQEPSAGMPHTHNVNVITTESGYTLLESTYVFVAVVLRFWSIDDVRQGNKQSSIGDVRLTSVLHLAKSYSNTTKYSASVAGTGQYVYLERSLFGTPTLNREFVITINFPPEMLNTEIVVQPIVSYLLPPSTGSDTTLNAANTVIEGPMGIVMTETSYNSALGF